MLKQECEILTRKKTMLAIFCFYDFEGIVDKYICYLLESIKDVVDDLVVIINGSITEIGVSRILNYTNQIYYRDNFGFDGGAFKDVFTQFISKEKLYSYDEIMILNNSFYGPVYPLKEVLEFMEEKKVDYWGITKTKRIESLWGEYTPHIQSYFMVFRKNIIQNRSFYEFWDKLKCSQDFNETVREFEIGVNRYLEERGYIGAAYTDFFGAQKYFKEYENPYYKATYQLIKECKCPFLKRKSINAENWIDFFKIIKFIENNTHYDVDYIWDNWERYDINKKIESYSIKQLVSFCESHHHIYVYGKGLYGKQKMEILNKLGYENAEYVVTKKDDDDDVKEIGDINFSNTDGIIIGVGPKYYDEVYKNAVSLVGVENVLTI